MSAALPMRLLLPLTLTTTNTTTSFPCSSSDFPFNNPLKTSNPNFNFYNSNSCTSRRKPSSFSKPTWLCGHMRNDQDMDCWGSEEENLVQMFGSDEDTGTQIPTQAQSIVEGSGAVMVSEFKPVVDVDYLQ